MKRKRTAVCESFLYKITDYDPVHKIYTLKNKKTGRVITMPKEDFDARLAEQEKAAGNSEEGK
jgi:hypothetical protein